MITDEKFRRENVPLKLLTAVNVVVLLLVAAGLAYENDILDRFTHAIIFVKPELVVVYDRLKAKEPSTFEYWLHAINKIDVKDQHDICVRNDDVVCDIDFLAPSGLTFKQTNEYDPKPRPRIKLREWHLTAETTEKKKRMEFVTLYRPHRVEDKVPNEAGLERIKGGYELKVRLSQGDFLALLPTDDSATLSAHGIKSKGAIKVCLNPPSGPVEILGFEE